MDDDRSSLVSRRPGDGGSEDHSARSSLAGELSFQRLSTVRQTYHGQGTQTLYSIYTYRLELRIVIPLSLMLIAVSVSLHVLQRFVSNQSEIALDHVRAGLR